MIVRGDDIEIYGKDILFLNSGHGVQYSSANTRTVLQETKNCSQR